MRVVDIAFLGTLAFAAGLGVRAHAEEFQMQEVPSLPQLAAGTPALHTILFTDHRKDELFDPVTGLPTSSVGAATSNSLILTVAKTTTILPPSD